MSNDMKTSSGGTVLFLASYNAGSHIDLANDVIGKQKNGNLWTYDFHSVSGSLMFLSPDLIDTATLPPNHAMWVEIDTLLEKLWAESDAIDPDIDDKWLDETRSSWNERLEDLYDGLDAGE